MKRFAAIAAAVIAATIGLAAPAQAGTTTTVTLTLVAGTLSINVPASTNLGNGTAGAQTTGSLGPVTVTDNRGTLLGTWTASVTSTDFTTGGGTTNETITKANFSYASLPATSTTGVGVFTPGQATVLLAQTLASSRTAYSASALVGNNTATWNPTIVVNVPAAAVAGVYTGTVTHSVA